MSQSTASVGRACGLETVLPVSDGLVILAARAMSSASTSIEFGKIAQNKIVNCAVDAFARDGTLPHTVKKHLSEQPSSTASTTGWVSNGMFTLLQTGFGYFMICTVPLESRQHAVVHRTM